MKITRATKFVLALLLATSSAALAASTNTNQSGQQPQSLSNQSQAQAGQPSTTQDKSKTGQSTAQKQPSDQGTQKNNEQAAGKQKSNEQNTTTAEAKQSQLTKIPGQIVLQSKDTVLASSLIGAGVYSPDNKVVGEVSDLIVANDGKVTGMVIGVGGFLGIGQKQIALQLDALNTELASDGKSVKILLNASSKDLDNAPAFKTAYQEKQEKAAARAQQEMQLRQQQGMQNNMGSQIPKSQPTQ